MRESAADLAALLADLNAYFYVCGLKAMEEGVVLALRDIATQAGLNWGYAGHLPSNKKGVCTWRLIDAANPRTLPNPAPDPPPQPVWGGAGHDGQTRRVQCL